MIFSIASLVATLVLTVAPAVSAFGDEKHGAHVGPRHLHDHHAVSEKVERGNLTERGFTYNNVRATWYNLGITACGDTYTSDDFVVALSQSTFGWDYPSKYCNREVVVSYGGKTANAKLVDSCVACSNYGPWCLDLSVGLFKHFADVGLGVIDVDWSFADGSGGDDGGDPPVKHTTSTHHTTSTRHTTSTHHTTTTHTTPTTTSHHTTSTTPKTTSTTTRAKPSTTSHSTTSTSSTTSSALPSTTSSSSDPSASGNILNINDVILNLEAILQAAAAN